MRNIPMRIKRIVNVVVMAVFITGLPVVVTGCENENTPKYWAKRVGSTPRAATQRRPRWLKPRR